MLRLSSGENYKYIFSVINIVEVLYLLLYIGLELIFE